MAGFRRALVVVLEIPAARLATLLPGLRGTLVIVLEVPTTMLAAFMARFRGFFAIIGKIARILILRHFVVLFKVESGHLQDDPKRYAPPGPLQLGAQNPQYNHTDNF
jgi:hypothetical protein